MNLEKLNDIDKTDIYDEHEHDGDDSLNSKYKYILNDYLNINEKLIEIELKELLLKYCNDIKNVNYLYQYWIHRRTICALLPFKHVNSFSYDYICHDYIKLIEYLDRQNETNLKTFCLIYNGIANIFLKHDTVSQTYGFDAFVAIKSESKQSDNDDDTYMNTNNDKRP